LTSSPCLEFHARTDLKNIKKTVAQHLSKNPNNQVTVFCAPPRAKPEHPFAIFFYETCLNLLMSGSLGIAELKVLFAILGLLDTENLVLRLSKTQIAEKIGLSRSVVSRAWSRLIENRILLDDKGTIYVNPHFMTRGRLALLKKSRAYALDEKQRIQHEESELSGYPLAKNF
jgi:hypothetical protein